MNNQLKKGVLELVILQLLNDNEMYGYEVVQYLENHIKVKESSIYIVLTRMYQNGFLLLREEKKGARKIKYYETSTEGKEYLKSLYLQWNEIVELVNITLYNNENNNK